jgi:hypothetical protein
MAVNLAIRMQWWWLLLVLLQDIRNCLVDDGRRTQQLHGKQQLQPFELQQRREPHPWCWCYESMLLLLKRRMMITTRAHARASSVVPMPVPILPVVADVSASRQKALERAAYTVVWTATAAAAIMQTTAVVPTTDADATTATATDAAPQKSQQFNWEVSQ